MGELRELSEGYRYRRRMEEFRDAWLIVNLVQPYTKEALKTLDFMPETRAQRESEFQRLREHLERIDGESPK